MYVSIKAIIALLTLITATFAIPVQSDVCKDEYLRHKQEGELGYDERTDNRCEGLFWDKKVAGQFEVISFLFGALNFDWREDVVLDVVFPDTRRDSDQDTIHVVAVTRAMGAYYRLDGRLPLQWPIGDVLYPARLNARKLGVYGIMEKDSIYVPLYVTQRSRKANNPPPGPAVLGLRSTIPVENISWQVSQRVKGRCSDYSKRTQIYNQRLLGTAAEIQFHSGEVISFTLPIDLVASLCIKVEGQEQESGEKVRYMLTAYFPSYKNE
jgi:hypothetical protein